ncbi:MAG: glycosyltransferase family 1 protein [Spirochaetales bacterium]|nr:glycosyltransferase family 1 protein [Spirochaetales bacterium]
MEKITVLSIYDRISVYHTLKPFLYSKHRKNQFDYTSDPEYVLNKDKNEVLIMLRWFLKPDKVDIEFLKAVRKKYRRIAFFNGNAGGSIIRPEVLPYVDLFYNKSLFVDRENHKKIFYGDELFSQYYHDNYGITDDYPRDRSLPQNDEDLKKLRISWNIGVADFPNARYAQRAGVALSRIFHVKLGKIFYHRNFWKGAAKADDPKPMAINARMGFPPPASIHYQRKMIVELIKDHPDFLYGRVSQHQFNKEIKKSKIILSPFGWGELCKRDFEAVYNRSLLLKPEMSHIETWPNIFKPEETYIPFKWDCSDLIEKGEYWLAHEKERLEVVENAFESYKTQINALDDRFEAIITEILG